MGFLEQNNYHIYRLLQRPHAHVTLSARHVRCVFWLFLSQVWCRTEEVLAAGTSSLIDLSSRTI